MNERQKILIVEDEEINRIILKRILQQDYDVIEAENGQIAWNMIVEKRQEITAVLLDIIMPVMDGYQVLDKIRENGMEDLPILVMTGEADPKTEHKALDSGAWDFVTKPYDAQVLLSRLRNAIARSKVSMLEQIQYLAQFDTLTGLYNRGKMFSETEQMLAEHPEDEFAFVRIDIDFFSLYTTSFGEEEGNRLLKYTADMIRQEIQYFPYCTYGRITADVFCVCCPYTDMEMIEERVKTSQEILSAYTQDYLLEFSFGIYLIEDKTCTIDEYYMRATKGARKCKHQYGVSMGIYDEKIETSIAEEMLIANDMETALAQEQFLVYFQPKVQLSKERACGAEALVRWLHPQRGLISPGVFVPIFEQNGFIAKVDYYVWEKTCQCLRKWLDLGYSPNPVSVNISRISLYNPQLVSQLVNLVKKYELPTPLLQLEITESAVMTNPELMQEIIHELRENGFTILMDDFGSGYSSLNTLKSLEFDVLKVDMKFMPVGKELEKGEIILASVIKMANWLGMGVVVEGVEERRQRDFIEGAGCDCIQGYFYSRPIPEEEYEEKYVIPLAKQQDDNTTVSNNSVPKHNVTILVIDDSPIIHGIIEANFGDEYYIHGCASGEEALAYLKYNRNKVRLMLVDNSMDGMSGIEFIEYCKKDAALDVIPKIMITASEVVGDQVKAFEAGAYDYITKPIVIEALKARVNHVMNVFNQISTHEKEEEHYRQQAEIDTATGLLNKVTFIEEATRLLEYDTEDQKALLVIDVDDFKKINDQYGHLLGDKVLKTIATQLSETFRTTDLIGRFGGDEFVVLMTGLSKQGVARRKADEVIRSVMFACSKLDHINVSISVGIAASEPDDNFNTVFARADQALYDAKTSGKAKTVYYGETVSSVTEGEDKPIVLVCGENPQLYPSIALAYGDTAGFAQIRSLTELKQVFEKYKERISVVCLDMEKQKLGDSEAFYQFILQQGGGETIPIIAVCQEGYLEQLQNALQLEIADIITLPPQADVIQRRLSKLL